MIELTDEVNIESLPELDLEDILKNRNYEKQQIENILSNDALILPEIARSDNTYEILKSEALEIRKLLPKEIKAEIIKDQKKKHKYLDLLSADIVLPIIVFLSWQAWDICKGFISAWLYAEYQSLKDRDKIPNAEVQVAIIDRKKGISKRAKISGPANFVSQAIKELKHEELFRK